jgi:cyclophilin family peptidyl-prolyl cis-trans isomerase/HEAT repeat protein
MRRRPLLAVVFAVAVLRGGVLGAQTVPAARVNVLAAEDRRAQLPRDLATLRAAARSRDPQTARLAVRALGRLERTDVIPDITPALRYPLPEVRSEAANALAQAARGWASASAMAAGTKTPSGAPAIEPLQNALIARLEDEEEPSVRAALCESLGRLPYRTVEQVDTAERVLLAQLDSSATITDRLGAAKALEAFVRLTRAIRPASEPVAGALRRLAGVAPPSDAEAGPLRYETDPLRDARVRRLALEGLMLIDAAAADIISRAAADADPQVRRLAIRAAARSKSVNSYDATFARGLEDPAPMVRLEALRGMRERGGDQACAVSLAMLRDADAHVSLLAIDQLSSCGTWSDAVARLESAIADESMAASPRGWHRAARASVALATAAPERAAATLGQLTGSSIWQLRMYAARTATILKDRERLALLARDANDNVVEAAIEGLRAVAGHDGDAVYVAALSRSGYQAIRVAALALDGSPAAETAVPALNAAFQRLVAEGRADSLDARTALAETLTRLGAPVPRPAAPKPAGAAPSGEELRRLAAPQARITMSGIGVFELALFATEAPLTVLHFADLAASGYYNGLTFHRVAPNFVIQGGSPGANEYVGQAAHMRDEVGLWPHVRGTVGISTRGRDTGDAQIFINLVDNPRLDHEYTVFAQVLNGMDVVERILEGDVIEKVEIVP